MGGHRERQHAVAEEGQARVGVLAPLAPGGMGEDLTREILRQLVQQLGQQHRLPPGRLRVLGLIDGSVVGEHEVHCCADRQDLGRLLVGHLDPVGVLELLHERVEVERVRLEVLLEAGLLVDRRSGPRPARRRGGRGSARRPADGRQAHPVWRRLASGADAGERLSAPASCERQMGLTDDVLAGAEPRPQDRLGEAGPREAPVRDDAQAAESEQVGAAAGLGVDLVAGPLSAPRSSSPPSLPRGRGRGGLADRTEDRLGVPSISFRAMLPVRPSVTTTSARR